MTAMQGQCNDGGQLVAFNMDRLRLQAFPEYVREGGGGVDAETVQDMLRSMIASLSRCATDAENDLHTALQLVDGLLVRQSERLRWVRSQAKQSAASGEALDAGALLTVLNSPINVIRY